MALKINNNVSTNNQASTGSNNNIVVVSNRFQVPQKKNMSTRRIFLEQLINRHIKETDTIIEKASEQCSQLKTFFIVFSLPAMATLLVGLFSTFNDGASCSCCLKDIHEFYMNYPRMYALTAFCFTFLTFIVALILHHNFFKRQSDYRRVKKSLIGLSETFHTQNFWIASKATYPTFEIMLGKMIETAKKSRIRQRAFLRDIIPYLLPYSLLMIFWIVMAFLGRG